MKNLYFEIHELAHGYVFIPILLALKPVFQYMMSERHVSKCTLYEKFHLNPGPFEIALKSIEGLGLLEVQEDTIVAKEGLEDLLKIPDELAELYQISPVEYLQTSNKKAFYKFFYSLSKEWEPIQNPTIKLFLNGAVFIPIFIGLFLKNKGALEKQQFVSLKGVSESVREEIVFIFKHFNLGLLSEDDRIKLTNHSKWLYENALNYSLGISYRPMLSSLQQLLFGNVATVFQGSSEAEKHVDRSLNVLSSGSMHRSYFQSILPSILDVFNDANIESQPAYIVDTGCGDGTFLKEVYHHIVTNTLRGKHLKQHPLLMIGVDYNAAALTETSLHLKRSKVPFMTIQGDIGDPEEILKSLSQNGVDIKKRILHIRSFLDHDRPFKMPEKNLPSTESNPSTAYTDQQGKAISSQLVLASLTEHFERWKKILKQNDDLMILEVHQLSPKKAFEERKQSISLHFDLIQALSGQFLVSAQDFLSCAAQAGLFSQYHASFPENKPYSRITFHHFAPSEYCIQQFKQLDLKETSLSQPIKKHASNWLQSAENSLFLLKRQHQNKPLALVYVKEVIHPKSSGECLSVHIEKMTSLSKEKKKNHRQIIRFIYDFFSIQKNYHQLTTALPPTELENLPTPASIGKDPSLITYDLQKHDIAENPMLQEHSIDSVLDVLKTEIATTFPNKQSFSQNDSILSWGLDSLELGKLARNLSKRLNTEVTISTLFKHPIIKDLAEKVSDKMSNVKPQSNPSHAESKSATETFPLSLSQEPMWFWYQLIGETSAYNVPRIEHLTGCFSIETFKKALGHVVSRHEILRSKYSVEKHRPVQSIIPLSEFELPFRVLDLTDDSPSKEQVADYLKNEVNAPFDLTAGETFRVLLILLNENECILTINMHHMVTDGSSIPIFWDELVKTYHAYLQGIDPDLPLLTNGYVCWAKKQRSSIESGAFDQEISYWKEKLSDNLPVLEIPTDFPYPEEQTFNGNRLDFELSQEVLHELKKLCSQENVTLFMALTALWSIFLLRHSGQSEIVIATPWANRQKGDIQNLIGCFVNTLPLRLKVCPGDTFIDLLRQVKDIALEAFEHSSIPFHKVVEKLNLQTQEGRLPVYQTMIALEEENGWIRGDTFEGTKRKAKKNSIHAIRNTSKFEISLSARSKLTKKGTFLSGEFVYNTDLFSDKTALRMRERLQFLLKQILSHPTQSLWSIDFLPSNELKKIMAFNPPKAPLPAGKTVFHLFEEQVHHAPQNIAVCSENRKLTYLQLWNDINRFSSYLLSQGVKQGDHVAVQMERDVELIIALYSLSQIGAVYIPISHSYPDERKKLVIQDSLAKFMITSSSQKALENLKIVVLNENILASLPQTSCNLRPSQTDMVYILYTSGTTGMPKGVKIPHSSLINNILHLTERQIPKKQFRLSLFSTNIVFDQFVEELYAPLSIGHTVFITDNILDLSWRTEPVTFLATTPSQMSIVLRNPVPKTLSSIVLGGEVLHDSLIQKIFLQTHVQTIYNSYGPTECTDQVTVCQITRESSELSLGKPISNAEIYILNETLNLLPIGAWGELCIGGTPVGLGYHNRDSLTQKQFVKNPFNHGSLYKSGDIARWNHLGQLEFKGREDDQIKIYGVRVEKGEIEKYLLSFAEVKEAFIHKTQDDQGLDQLIAYVTPKNLDISKLWEACARALPMHLVPKQIILLESLPLTCSGKVNIKKLPLPTLTPPRHSQSNPQSGTRVESLIALFKKVLDLQEIDENSSFFKLGGHSLLAVHLIALIKQKLGKRLKMRELLCNDTPKSLERCLTPEHPQSLEVKEEQTPAIHFKEVASAKNSILIIGAGIAGIMAAIECQKRGLNFQIVDQSKGFGGIWLSGCNEASKLQTTSKVYQVDPSFKHKCLYPNRKQILSYLSDIVLSHQLDKRVSFFTQVKDVKKKGDGFEIEAINTKTTQKSTLKHDGILVCTGKHHTPFVPNWTIQDGCPQITHASSLDQVNFQGLNALIIGGGSYAIEALRIAHQKGAKNVTMAARKAYWVLPSIIDTILYSGIGSDLSFNKEYDKHVERLNQWLSLFYQQHGLEHFIPLKENQVFDAHISTSDEFFQITEKENVHVQVDEIDFLTKEGAALKNGQFIPADLIVAATGYHDPDLSFLHSISNNNPLVYKGFMLANDPRIGFAGFLDMVVSATAVMPLNLKLALDAITHSTARPPIDRVKKWIEEMPIDMLKNIKSHYLWLNEEKNFLEKQAIACMDPRGSISYENLSKIVEEIVSSHPWNCSLLILPETTEALVALLAALKSSKKLFLLPPNFPPSALDEILDHESLDTLVVSKEIHQNNTSLRNLKVKNRCFIDDISEKLFACREENTQSSLIDPPEKLFDFVDSLECIFWTSGSTGKPKGVIHTASSLKASIEGFASTSLKGMEVPPRLLFQNNLSHFGGFLSALATLHQNGTLIFHPSTSLTEKEKIETYQPNLLIQMASKFHGLFKDMLNSQTSLSSLKRVILGGEPLKPNAASFLKEHCPIPIHFTFGISECGPLFHSNLEESHEPVLGKPLPGVVVRSPDGKEGDIQELLVSSPSLFKGYYKNSSLSGEIFDQQGYFKTGDFVQVTSSGTLVFKGRKQDQITPELFTSDIEKLIIQTFHLPQVLVAYEKASSRLYVCFELDSNRDEIERKIKHFLKQRYAPMSFSIHFSSSFSDNSSINQKSHRFSIPKTPKIIHRPKAIFFPGQGTQHREMTSNILKMKKVQKLYDHAGEILGYDILKISKGEKGNLLNQTEYCQVAIYLASIGELMWHQERDPGFLDDCQFALGLSLGEYTALSAAGALSIEDGIHLLSLRGKAMQQASDSSNQVMISLSHISEEEVKTFVDLINDQLTHDKVYIANRLHSQHCVIAGNIKPCQQVAEKAEKAGALTAQLNVSGAFHTPLMTPATKTLSTHLKKVTLSRPTFKIVSNVDGKPTISIRKIRENLIKQIDLPVQFSASIDLLKEAGLQQEDMLEIGPQKTVTNLLFKHFNEEVKIS